MESRLAVLLVDPETREGCWLQRSLRGPITKTAATKLNGVLGVVRDRWEEPLDAPESGTLIRSVIPRLCAGPPPPDALDERVLSPSRFADLFNEQVGLPFRRYALWRRLTRAMLAVGQGKGAAEKGRTSAAGGAAPPRSGGGTWEGPGG